MSLCYGIASITPTPETNCDDATDPLASLSAPAYGGCNFIGLELDDAITTLYPGVYCDGLTIKNNSDVTFNPGTYIIKDGQFFVDSNSHITGSEVGFYLTGDDATLHFTSNTHVTLTPQISGGMIGVLFFQDPNFGGTHIFDSNNAGTLDGALYFPSGRFEANSNTTMAGSSSCFMLIADTIEFNSNAGVQMSGDLEDCPIESILEGKDGRLVHSG